MSDIPSHLSKWEPPRALKIGFLATVVLSFLILFGAKIYTATIVAGAKLEQAIHAERQAGPAPAFTLKDRAGRTVSLTDYAGKVVFLNFWATWCAPCREEMPSLGELARTIDPANTVFLAVSVDDGWEPVNQFFGRTPPPFQLLLDADKAVSTRYGSSAYPESYLIGPDGTLLYKFVGARDWSSIAAIKILERAGAHRLPPSAAKS